MTCGQPLPQTTSGKSTAGGYHTEQPPEQQSASAISILSLLNPKSALPCVEEQPGTDKDTRIPFSASGADPAGTSSTATSPACSDAGTGTATAIGRHHASFEQPVTDVTALNPFPTKSPTTTVSRGSLEPSPETGKGTKLELYRGFLDRLVLESQRKVTAADTKTSVHEEGSSLKPQPDQNLTPQWALSKRPSSEEIHQPAAKKQNVAEARPSQAEALSVVDDEASSASRNLEILPGPSETLTQDQDELDSAVGDLSSDATASRTASLSSSIVNYPNEHGRTYHAPQRDVFYIFPNDKKELARLDLKHKISLFMNDSKLYLWPVGKPTRVLDIGTGTGTWAIEVADSHPQAIVTRIDISPTQPTWVAPNCKFEIYNFEAPWNFEDKFDFIHARDLFGCIRHPTNFLQEAYDNLEEGGEIHIQDFGLPVSDDNTIEQDSAYHHWIENYRQAMLKINRDPDLAQKYGEILQKVGFVDVKWVQKMLPHNEWHEDARFKELGRYNQRNINEGLEAFSLRLFVGVLGWSQDRLLPLLAGVRKELRDTKIHAYTPVYFYRGRKPPAVSPRMDQIPDLN